MSTRFLTNLGILFCTLFFLSSCSTISLSELESKDGKWFNDGKPYSGEAYLSSKSKPGDLAFLLLNMMRFGDSTVYEMEDGVIVVAWTFHKKQRLLKHEFTFDDKGSLINNKMFQVHNGLWTVTNLITELNYLNDEKHGYSNVIRNMERKETLYDNGEKIKESIYSLSPAVWGVQEHLSRITPFVDEKQQGDQIFYYRNDTVIKKICTYHHDRLRSTKEFSLNGVLIKHEKHRIEQPIILQGEVITKVYDGRLKTLYKDGKKNGLETKYYDDGTKWEEVQYVNDVRQGDYKSWYRNGEREKECTYKNDEINGRAKAWYNDGDLWEETNYKNGKKHGLSQKWYTNGNQALEVMYDEDSQHGLFREWYTNGQLWKEKTHNHGRVMKEQRWYKDGKPAFTRGR